MSAGAHNLDLELADLAGNVTAQSLSFNVGTGNNIYVSPATNPGWGRIFSNGFSLAEGGSLIAQNSIDVALGGAGKRSIDFDLSTSFDKSDSKSTAKDRVAVYLVDNSGNPLALDATHPGGVPLFSLSETGSEIIPGLVKFDGTHVSIDVSNVAATSGKLVIQMLNQDGDSGSSVKVTNFANTLDAKGTKGTSVAPAPTPVAPGAATVLDNYIATSNAQILLSNVSLDKATGKYTADLRLQNVGTSTLSQNLAVLLTGLPSGVSVTNSSGTHAAGSPYLNFNTAIQAGGLIAGGISDTIRVNISDPSLVAFGFKPLVLQGAAAPLPDLSSLRNLTVKVGDKIDIPLTGELAIKTDVKLPTGAITGDGHLVFKPAPDQVGTYNFTLIDRVNGTETQQAVTLKVVADPVTTTRVTGQIADTNQAGLAGVLVELSGYQATTDANGKFTIVLPDGAPGDTLKVYGQRIQTGGTTYPFIAEKMPLLLGHDLYRNVNNQIDRPIYLPLIDSSTGRTIDPNAVTSVSNPKLTGAKVEVPAHSLFDKNGNAFAGVLSITQVPTSLTPAALPSNLHPDLVVTIQPGDMVFNTPARLTLPNRAGYLPGLEMDLWSINPNTGAFEIVGKGRVSADGSKIETIEGGIRNSSWHFVVPTAPAPPIGDNPQNPDPDDDDKHKSTDNFKSQVSTFAGTVSDDRQLVSYQSQGVTRGIDLHYDSGRANPETIIHVGGRFRNLTPSDRITTKVTLMANGIEQTALGLNSSQLSGLTGGERMWVVPSNATDGSMVDSSVQFDLSHLASGVYKYKVDNGIQGFRTWFGGFNPATQSPFIASGIVGSTSTREDRTVVINDADSGFGAGWNVAGLQRLVVNEDNSVLLIDGDGTHTIFSSLGANSKIYQSPPGDFSTVKKLATGGFERTTKDGTRYEFNSKGLMFAATDRQGNKTQHIYNASGQIQTIIDPVGLETKFIYSGNRVKYIVDPAKRQTTLEYDAAGNLILITDPDGVTKDRYGYDAHHRVTSSIDKNGQAKTGTYDEFGRAKTATREDGSIVQIDPISTQGVKNRQETTDLANPATAQLFTAERAASYTDGNGNTVTKKLDRRGHIISSKDEIGDRAQTNYNDNYLITSAVDAKGHAINYQYDSQGNVISESENIEVAAKLGTIDRYTPLETPGSNAKFATGDINDDGIDDIVTTTSTDKLNILLGNATTPLATKSTISTGAVNNSQSIDYLELKDVNGDGKLDIIANLPGNAGGGYGGYGISAGMAAFAADASTGATSSSILVFINQGGGVFSAPQSLSLDGVSEGFVTGDFNGDNNLDILAYSKAGSTIPITYTARTLQLNSPALATTNSPNNTLVLFTGDGVGNFTQSTIDIPLSSSSNNYIQSLKAVDIKGKKGLVINSGNELVVWNRDLAGGWQDIYHNNTDYNSRTQVVVGDLNGDGISDIITSGAYSSTAQILFSQTDGSFAAQIFNPTDSDLKYIQYLNISDIDGNGKSDLTICGTNALGNIAIKSYDVNPVESLTQIGTTKKTYLTYYYAQFAGLADINGDGNANLLINLSGSTESIGVLRDNLDFYNVSKSVTKFYTYDAVFNQLTSETDELGHKTLYDLDPTTGQTLKTTRVVGQLDSVANGETDDVVTSSTYTSTGQIDLMTDALGHITDYDYDARGNLVKLTTAKGNADEAIEQYEYDLAGNKTADIDALGHRTEYTYNSMNMLLQTKDAKGGKTTYNYDKMGHQTSSTDALGHVTKMTYDSQGRLVSTIDANGGTTTNAYDNNGNLLSTTDALGRTTSNQYDARNRQIATVNADGSTIKNQYDASDRITGDTNALGHETQKFYDGRNRVSREIDAMGNEIKYSYDATNKLTIITDAEGKVTQYQYDALGRKIAVIDTQGHTTRTEYDKLGEVTATVDANGNRTEYKYDAQNRQIQVKDAKGGITKTTYDKYGSILSITDANNNTTTYTYDALNQQITDTNQLGKTRTFAYDAVGNKISTIDREGRIITNAYDNLNRLTSEKWLTSNGTVINEIVSNYDAIGQLTSTYDFNSKYTYTYDLNGWTTSIDNTGTTGIPNVFLNYTYDANGNTLSVVDSINGLNAGNLAYTYDNLDRVTQITQSGTGVQSKRVNMTYDPLGSLSSINRYRDLTGTQLAIGTSYTYDSLHRLTGIGHKNAANVSVNSYAYQYDAGLRINQITSVDGVVNYSYDNTNQLTGADYSTQTDEAYSYDANGNRTNSGYVNGANNQLFSDSAYNYQYDGEGNRTKRIETATGRVTEYIWDYHNRLTKLAFKDIAGNVTKTIEYLYDVNDRRIGKKIDGVVTERYILDRDQISLVFDGNGNQSHRYLYGTEVDQVLADEVGGNTRWLLADHQGTIKDVVDATGTVLDHVNYDSFGNIVTQTSPIDLRFGYTGREQDTETGLYYYRARYYDSFVGKFISEDPLGFEGDDTNLNRYVENSPIDRTDPSGLYPQVLYQVRSIEYRTSTGIGYSDNTTDLRKIRKEDKSFRITKDQTLAVIDNRGKTPSGETLTITASDKISGVDDKGHIVAKRLGGKNERKNIFSINFRTNQQGGRWFKYEENISNQLKQLSKLDLPDCPVRLVFNVNLENYPAQKDYPPQNRFFRVYSLRPRKFSSNAGIFAFKDGIAPMPLWADSKEFKNNEYV